MNFILYNVVIRRFDFPGEVINMLDYNFVVSSNLSNSIMVTFRPIPLGKA